MCKQVNFAFETARSSLRYEGVGKRIVHALRHRRYTAVVDRFAAPLPAEVVEDPGACDAVLAVPLHRARPRRRGFNQAALLARGLAGRINTPPFSDTLQVVRSTRDQVELSAAGRRRRLAGAFPAGGRARGGPLPVDGVLTTNARANARANACANVCAAPRRRRRRSPRRDAVQEVLVGSHQSSAFSSLLLGTRGGPVAIA